MERAVERGPVSLVNLIVGDREQFVDNIDLKQRACRHVAADLGNPQCCWTRERISDAIKETTLNIWCCDPRGGTPRYCILGGSWAVLFRLLGTFLHLVPELAVHRAHTALRREFQGLCDYYRTLVRPCTHGADDGLGCGYLGEIERYPGKYGLHAGISECVGMLDACRSEHDGYETVCGEREQALGAIVVRSEEAIPMITPKQGADMFFVWHPQVEELLLDRVAARMARRFQAVTGLGVDPLRFREHLWELTRIHVRLALEKLAPGKPVFELSIRAGAVV